MNGMNPFVIGEVLDGNATDAAVEEYIAQSEPGNND
jgi:hypothetical protein